MLPSTPQERCQAPVTRRSYLLLEEHDLVALKVGQVATDGSLGNLLSGIGSLKLGNESRLFQVLADDAGASATGQRLDDVVGEGDAL